MPGDDAGMEMEEITSVQVPRQPHRNSTPQLGNDSDTLHQDDSTPMLLDPDHARSTQVTDTHTTPRRRRMGKKARSSHNNKIKRAETLAHYRTQDMYIEKLSRSRGKGTALSIAYILMCYHHLPHIPSPFFYMTLTNVTSKDHVPRATRLLDSLMLIHAPPHTHTLPECNLNTSTLIIPPLDCLHLNSTYHVIYISTISMKTTPLPLPPDDTQQGSLTV